MMGLIAKVAHVVTGLTNETDSTLYLLPDGVDSKSGGIIVFAWARAFRGRQLYTMT